MPSISAHLSQGAIATIEAIGSGWRLRVPHDKTQTATLTQRTKGPVLTKILSTDISSGLLGELLDSGHLRKLTELGEPPVGERCSGPQPRRGRPTILDSYRPGWRELGYDGDIADWYTLLQ